jgi:predicted GNAT superfamily acetyltransferase
MSETKPFYIRRVQTVEEYEACQQVHRTVWGFSKEDTVMHLPMMVALQNYGGIILGAFVRQADGTEKLIGFVVGFIGKDPHTGEYFHYSQVAGALQEYQSAGVGYALKTAQRDEALQQGYNLMRWAFDPLEARNAYFNIAKLGGVARHYELNMYGVGKGELFGSLATDRLIIDWELDSDNVKRKLSRESQELELSKILAQTEYQRFPRLINLHWLADNIPVIESVDISREDSFLALEIPYANKQVQKYDFNLAVQWRTETRQLFRHYFHKGYYVAGFFTIDENNRKRAFYILKKS